MNTPVQIFNFCDRKYRNDTHQCWIGFHFSNIYSIMLEMSTRNIDRFCNPLIKSYNPFLFLTFESGKYMRIKWNWVVGYQYWHYNLVIYVSNINKLYFYSFCVKNVFELFYNISNIWKFYTPIHYYIRKEIE